MIWIEVERLLTDGMRNIAGAERTADILFLFA
jgi:hypothetical protein